MNLGSGDNCFRGTVILEDSQWFFLGREFKLSVEVEVHEQIDWEYFSDRNKSKSGQDLQKILKPQRIKSSNLENNNRTWFYKTFFIAWWWGLRGLAWLLIGCWWSVHVDRTQEIFARKFVRIWFIEFLPHDFLKIQSKVSCFKKLCIFLNWDCQIFQWCMKMPLGGTL